MDDVVAASLSQIRQSLDIKMEVNEDEADSSSSATSGDVRRSQTSASTVVAVSDIPDIPIVSCLEYRRALLPTPPLDAIILQLAKRSRLLAPGSWLHERDRQLLVLAQTAPHLHFYC